MKIIVDADSCPVKEIIIDVAQRHLVGLIFVCDTAHVLSVSYGTVKTVDKHADSADFVIVNLAGKGDIVVTNDYGLAAMALSKKAYVINPNGVIFSADNMDRLLFERHMNKKRGFPAIEAVPSKSAGLQTTKIF